MQNIIMHDESGKNVSMVLVDKVVFDRLHAQNERLRDALTRIVTYTRDRLCNCAECPHGCEMCEDEYAFQCGQKPIEDIYRQAFSSQEE